MSHSLANESPPAVAISVLRNLGDKASVIGEKIKSVSDRQVKLAGVRTNRLMHQVDVSFLFRARSRTSSQGGYVSFGHGSVCLPIPARTAFRTLVDGLN